MTGEFRELLACPACRGELRWTSERADCASCGVAYPTEGGVADFTVAGGDGDEQKRLQARHFDEDVDSEFEIERPRGSPAFHRWLIGEKLRRSVDRLDGLLRGATALTVCGGSGMEAEFLARRGARVVTADISPGAAARALERARRRGFELCSVVADAERLPLRDRAVDLAYVHDGLHHVPHPCTALAEMARVAAWAVSVTEPAQAAATRIAVRLGIALEVEDAGNRVERLTPDEIARYLHAAGFELLRAERYAMFYRHRPGPLSIAFSRPSLLPVARAGFRVANLAIARGGNKLTVQARRRDV